MSSMSAMVIFGVMLVSVCARFRVATLLWVVFGTVLLLDRIRDMFPFDRWLGSNLAAFAPDSADTLLLLRMTVFVAVTVSLALGIGVGIRAFQPKGRPLRRADFARAKREWLRQEHDNC